MKRVFLLIMFCIPFLGSAQNVNEIEPDSRLKEVFEDDYLANLTKTNPFLIERWNYYLDHSFYVTDFSNEKGVSYESITIPDFNNINIFLLEKQYNMERHHDLPSVYLIEGTQKALIYYSGEEFIKRFNNARNNK